MNTRFQIALIMFYDNYTIPYNHIPSRAVCRTVLHKVPHSNRRKPIDRYCSADTRPSESK